MVFTINNLLQHTYINKLSCWSEVTHEKSKMNVQHTSQSRAERVSIRKVQNKFLYNSFGKFNQHDVVPTC
ncbi:hypothetical protein MtrunA17_Chr7g0240031 [Medicago truncatula]|uniref:Uncharacterized protein n=1 Tax=Medicago truncatula TaxID=3880 RepID=A0A396GYR1_MEDTR|nr:hypothetical protein MtrunA17_Chr7g0240031 [Medicago truncatula]